MGLLFNFLLGVFFWQSSRPDSSGAYAGIALVLGSIAYVTIQEVRGIKYRRTDRAAG